MTMIFWCCEVPQIIDLPLKISDVVYPWIIRKIVPARSSFIQLGYHPLETADGIFKPIQAIEMIYYADDSP